MIKTVMTHQFFNRGVVRHVLRKKHLIFFYNPGCPGQLTCTTTNSRTH